MKAKTETQIKAYRAARREERLQAQVKENKRIGDIMNNYTNINGVLVRK